MQCLLYTFASTYVAQGMKPVKRLDKTFDNK